MVILNSPEINEIRKQVQKIKKEEPEGKIIVQARDPDFNRKVLEISGINILLGPETHSGKDGLKQTDSGLNEILCKIAKKNNISIGIDLEKILKMDKLEKSKALARIIQNIRLCRKIGVDIIIYPKERFSKQDAASFFLTLGASTSQINTLK